MASEQLYVPNIARKWISIDYPRLTGKSIIMIGNYLNQFSDGDEHVPGSADYMDLGEFLPALLYFRLSEQYLSVFSDNILTLSGHPVACPPKQYRSVDDYYAERKFGTHEISIFVEKALEEGYMTYDDLPFDGALVLNTDEIYTNYRDVYYWIEEILLYGDIPVSDIPDKFWEIYYVIRQLFSPETGWNIPHYWDDILFSMINIEYTSPDQSEQYSEKMNKILEELEDIVLKYSLKREIDLSKFSYMLPGSETPGIIIIRRDGSFDPTDLYFI